MPVEQALEELKKYAKDFASIGDAKEFIKSNKDEFIQKWSKVMQYYNYILKNDSSRDIWIQAIDIVDDIRYDNPSLDEWIEDIFEPKRDKKQEKIQSQTDVSIDTTALSNQIESYTSEVKNMQSWNPEYINDVEWKLQELKNMLISSRKSFEFQLYNSLMDDINDSLDKIGRFNDMLNSEVIEGQKRR